MLSAQPLLQGSPNVKVIVSSENPVKLRATREAFGTQFPNKKIEYITLTVDSGVDDQPFSDDETRHGAINRSHNACEEYPEADFWVGLEGGVDTFNGQLMTFAWMAVLGPGGRTSTARTMTLPLPPAVKKRVEEGMELGDANDRVFSTANSKHEGGAFGLLTGDRFTREGVYTDTLTIALVPFTNKLYEKE